MKVRTFLVWASVSLMLAGACAAKRLPPGTPPPEYEDRPFVPWDENPAPPAPDPTPSESTPQGEIPDAGLLPPSDAAAAGPEVGSGAFPERSVE